MRKPYNAIDGIRCVLICLVVLVHIVNFGRLHPDVKEAVNFFFMPAFLLVTGYLVNFRVGAGAFCLYLLRIALPYVVMSVGFAVMSLWVPVEGGLGVFSWSGLADVLLVHPIGPYWFLHAMLVCGVVCYVSISNARPAGVGGALCLMACLLAAVSWTTPLAFVYVTFYFLGVALRLCGADFLKFFAPSPWAALPFGAIFLFCYPSGGGLSVAGLSVCFFCFVAWVWGRLGGRAARVVGYVGRNTLPIYLFHPLFTLVAKFALPLFDFDATGGVHAIFTVSVAVAGSLAIAWTFDRTGACRLFARGALLR